MALAKGPLVGSDDRHNLRVPVLPIVAAGLLAVFLLAPWPLAHKAHALLHGLCAQRPSHSLTLGGQVLPFDARMTGIYGGFAIAFSWLAARGGLRAWRLPDRTTSALLVLFVAALGVDGLNALAVDLRLDPLYQPDNRIRLATGLLTGISLAAGLGYLLATTLWRSGDLHRRTLSGVGELALVAALTAPFALLALSGVGWLYLPMAVLLVAAAATAVGAIVLATWVLVAGRDRGYDGVADIQAPAAISLAMAVAVMLAIAGARFWLERTFGIRTLD